MSRTQRLAEAILADRQREAAAHNIVACFVCGRTFMYRGRRGDLNGRLCSLRCQDRYDAGNEPIGEEIVYRWRDGQSMKKGSKGFYSTPTAAKSSRALAYAAARSNATAPTANVSTI